MANTTPDNLRALSASELRGDALEDANTAARRLREDPKNNRALGELYKLCHEHGLRCLVVDAPDCDGSIMAEASLRIRAGVFSFGACLAKPC